MGRGRGSNHPRAARDISGTGPPVTEVTSDSPREGAVSRVEPWDVLRLTPDIFQG